MGKTQPIQVIEKVVKVLEPLVWFPFSLQAQWPLGFADIQRLPPDSVILLWTSTELVSFALSAAFRRSDYQDTSDALSRHRQTACLNILLGAAHVHRAGLNGVVEVAVITMTNPALCGSPNVNRVQPVIC